MSSHTPNITALTRDYDAIERAIRETSRGRWFLNCYLERNRSAETRLLLDAIARLENAMRENGHAVESYRLADSFANIAEAIGEAREDIAETAAPDGAAASLPLTRFSFGAIPEEALATTESIRTAASAIEIAAEALHNAGVFQAVARQISDKSAEILQACAAQDRAVTQLRRMAGLVGEVEAEILGAIEAGEFGHAPAPLGGRDDACLHIPELVMAELSRALCENPLADNDTDFDPR